MKKYIPLTIGILAVALLLALMASKGNAQQANPVREQPAGLQAVTRSSFIPIQGMLTDSSGNPLTGYYDLTFNLYDASTGGTILCTDTVMGVNLTDGLFNTYMNMQGCAAIDGRQLYLGIQVGADPEMTPRQYIDNVPYAWTLRPGANISGSIGTDAILDIDNYASTGRGLRSEALATTGQNYAVIGATCSPDGFGGYFYNTTYAGFGLVGLQYDNYDVSDYTDFYKSGGLFGGVNGVIGISHESVRVGAGVYGWAQAATGTGYGVRGRSDSSNGQGVYGQATATTGNTEGVYGISESIAGKGVFGYAAATSGTTYGIYGESNSPNGSGVYGLADTSGGIGVKGESEVGTGVYGESVSGFGVYGHSTSNNAVYGDTIRGDHNYGLYTPDNLYALNYHVSGAVMQVVQNGSSEALEAGDVVVFSGVIPSADSNEPPMIMVSKANTANSTAVAGVVYRRYSLEGAELEGAAQPGETLLLIVQGSAQVKVSASEGAIQVGDLLSSGPQAGFAVSATKITLEGIQITIPGTIFAKALETLESGDGWIYVYVTLQ